MEDAQRDKQDLDSWMSAVARGDKEAFAALYRRLRTPVYGLALSIVRDSGDAEDIVQSVFIKVWDCAGQYRPGSDVKAWMLKITRNLALMQLRGRKRAAPWGEWAEELPAGDETEPLLDRLLLQTLLQRLDESERQVVMLYAVSGYSHKEIAAFLGKPYATVRWKYSNAMKKLTRELEASEQQTDKHSRKGAAQWIRNKG